MFIYNKLFKKPYITYHPGEGSLDFKTKNDKKLLINKIDSYKYSDIKKNKIYEIFCIEISPTIFNKLEKIPADTVKKLQKRNCINLIEVDQNFKEIIKLDDDKETFIIFDIAIKNNLNLFFNINKIIGKKVLEKYSDDNYISTYFLNSILCLTVFFKENNIKTRNITHDLKVTMEKSSFNLKLVQY